MLNLAVFVCFFLFVVGESLASDSDSTSLKCYSFNNEEISCVTACPPETTCQNRGALYRCKEDNVKCEPKCVCKKGYFRNAIGNCISEENCDRCDEDKNEYYSCGGFCDNVCSELKVQNQTNCPIVNIKCNEKCYCLDGYARNTQNICVPIQECDSNHKVKNQKRNTASLCTDPNEIHQTCMKSCPPDTCISLVARFKCDSGETGKPGCKCRDGYLREKAGLPCIPIKQCPQLKNSPDFN